MIENSPGDAGAAPRALQGLLTAGIEALRTRLELAAVELEIHLGVTALIVALWNTHRMLGLLGGSVVFVALAALLGYLGLRTLRNRPGPLEGSLAQLAEDERRVGGAT